MTRTQPLGPPATLVSGLNHAAIVTADLDRLASFYVDVFGATTIDPPAPPGTRALIVQFSPTSGFALMEMAANPHTSGSTTMLARGHLDHIALDAPSPAALEEVRRRLVEVGASDGMVSDYGPMLSVYFVDPDGMGSEVCWLRDASFAGSHAPIPFEGSLLDLERELQAARS